MGRTLSPLYCHTEIFANVINNMKYIPLRFTILFFIFFCVNAKSNAQSLRAELNISPRPSTRLADWTSRRETVSLLVYSTSDKIVSVKIDAKLSLNGNLIASTKLGSMPVLTIPVGGPTIFYAADIFPENAVSFFGDMKQTTMRSGILPEGNYELCITLVNVQTTQPVSQPVCRTFFLTKYILPTLLQPEDNKKLPSGIEKTTLFVWTPIIPNPPMPVTYRLRMVEVLPGQSAQQAFTVNQPLFERTTVGSTQLLWPQEIPLPDAGVNLAWGIQPEDDQGNPIILPERFTNAFTLIVLPSKEGCGKLLQNIKKLREHGLEIEEQYWTTYEHFARVTQLLEEAEERADVLDIEKQKKEQKNSDAKLEKIKIVFNAARAKYDTAVGEYETCIGK